MAGDMAADEVLQLDDMAGVDLSRPPDRLQGRRIELRVGRGLGQGLERLTARGNPRHVVALEPQGTVDRPADRSVVVHHQDAHDHRTYRRASAGHRAN